MKILKSWLQDHIEDKLPSDEIITDSLMMKSSEIEGVDGVTVDGKSDTVFDVKVLPDRAHYMLSHRGVAGDLCAILGLKLRLEAAKVPNIGTDVKVEIKSENCNRYSAILIKDIKNEESPKWLKDRLEAIGARSINIVVDATNYAMFDTGQPLHAFDADRVVGGIVVRSADDGEEIELLPERVLIDGKWQEKQRILKLNSSDMVIADEKGPLAIAGVKGGLRAVVTGDTKNIILESASFNPVAVRKTSTKYNIRNDSSKRFENEITAHMVPRGSSVFLDLIEKMSPNCKVGSMTDAYKTLPERWSVKVGHKKIESILNITVSSARVIEILNSLGMDAKIESEGYTVTPSSERLDVIIEEDVIDEIGRVEGLDKIKSILPKVKTGHEFSAEFIITEKIKDFFAEKGFSEVQNRSFSNKGDIEVAYPMASDKRFLRTSLVEGVRENIEKAILNAPILGLDKIEIFEIGKVFTKDGESLELCFAIDFAKKVKNKDVVIKGELEQLVKDLGEVAGQTFVAEISKNIACVKNIDASESASDISSIKIGQASRNQFKPFSNEPFMVRDIAIFVSENVEAGVVESVVRKTATEASNINVVDPLLVKGPDLFDQFEKDGKKSLAFRMIFQAMDRTLTDTEVNTIMEKVYADVKGKGWEVR